MQSQLGYGHGMGDVSLSFAGRRFEPLPCGALYWPEQKALLIADLHLEKGSSFARSGWLLPPHDSIDTVARLAAAVEQTGPQRIIALGDSFHDAGGATRLEDGASAILRQLLSNSEWIWVTGNHDADSGEALGGRAVGEMLIDGIHLRHEAAAGCGVPEISGHYHPKIAMTLRAGLRVSRRCMAMTADRLVLPAYGSYAGGLSVDDPVFETALGACPDALVALPGRLLRLSAEKRRIAA